MKNELNKTNISKKTYQKPQLRQVQLRPDEAVLGNCKSNSGSGGLSGGSCNNGVACNNIGS